MHGIVWAMIGRGYTLRLSEIIYVRFIYLICSSGRRHIGHIGYQLTGRLPAYARRARGRGHGEFTGTRAQVTL